jgi:hypothetical protein
LEQRGESAAWNVWFACRGIIDGGKGFVFSSSSSSRFYLLLVSVCLKEFGFLVWMFVHG